jgi:hypothetical protein
VRQRTDGRSNRVVRCGVSDNEPLPWNAAFTCLRCGRRLIPLRYTVPPHEDPRGKERPALKCTGCSETYRLHDNPGWVAVIEGE